MVFTKLGPAAYAKAAYQAAHLAYRGGRYLIKQNQKMYDKNKKRARKTGLITGSAPDKSPSVPRSMANTQSENPGGIDSSTIRLERSHISLRSVKAGFGIFQYTQTHSGSMQVNAGEQQAQDCFSVNTPQQCTVSTTGVAPLFYQGNTAFHLLNPYQQPQNNFTSTTFANNIFQDRYIIRSNDIEMHVCNPSNVSITADVYILKCKKNNTNAPFTLHNSGFENERLNTANGIFTHTATGTNGVAGYLSLAYPGVKVGTNAHFRNHYSVAAVRSLKLASGAQEVINIQIKINKLIKNDYMQDLATGGVINAANQSYHVMLVSKGGILVDVTAGSPGIPTYAEHRVIWTAQVMTRLSAVKGNSERLDFNRGVNTLPLTALRSNQELVDADGDEVDVNYVL